MTSLPQVLEKPQAVPSIDPPPMRRHIIEREKDPDDPRGQRFLPTTFKDLTLCGKLWDRILPTTPGPICDECAEVARKRHE